MITEKEKIIKCPNCGKEIFFCYDEWGYTTIHLHCNNCHINIGANSFKECENLFKEHHKPYTYLEYYGKKIQFITEMR